MFLFALATVARSLARRRPLACYFGAPVLCYPPASIRHADTPMAGRAALHLTGRPGLRWSEIAVGCHCLWPIFHLGQLNRRRNLAAD